jgi:hypothetical protein
MDAASTRLFDTPSISLGASPHRGRPFRNSEPNPVAWGRLPAPTTVGHFAIPGHDSRANTTSATWTSSSGDWADLSDTDHLEIRDEFVQEYNQLARKHGIRTLAPPDHSSPSLVSCPSPFSYPSPCSDCTILARPIPIAAAKKLVLAHLSAPGFHYKRCQLHKVRQESQAQAQR